MKEYQDSLNWIPQGVSLPYIGTDGSPTIIDFPFFIIVV
jgi:hypothetical protein